MQCTLFKQTETGTKHCKTAKAMFMLSHQ